ncbi:hypothetical protein [Embleya sp. NPDC005971]|uniref:hypothetical protein n=1 Tax=Embleya sp. NPDC005971 TaxID=3156724 RepID=UPI00340995D0
MSTAAVWRVVLMSNDGKRGYWYDISARSTADRRSLAITALNHHLKTGGQDDVDTTKTKVERIK